MKTPTTVSEQLNAMEDLIKSNLKQCCVDVKRWNASGLLPANSVIRKASALLVVYGRPDDSIDDVFYANHLIHVENCIKRLAMEFVIDNK